MLSFANTIDSLCQPYLPKDLPRNEQHHQQCGSNNDSKKRSRVFSNTLSSSDGEVKIVFYPSSSLSQPDAGHESVYRSDERTEQKEVREKK
jgi:hypothetical protein